MKIKIKIEKSSIKRNENAGQTTFLVPGRCVLEDGIVTRPVQLIRSLNPIPNFSADYIPTEIECRECHSKFFYTELEEDELADGTYSDTICPKCGEWYCCDIEFEKFNDSTGKIEE